VRDAVSIPPSYRRPETIEEYNSQLRLAARHFPKEADFFRSLIAEDEELLAIDVRKRLESARRRLADRFTREISETVRVHHITSPIEQVFLMEWKLSNAESQHQLVLEPQSPIEVGDGTFFIDFLVCSAGDHSEQGRVGIELDGHQFHEKTAKQATHDKKRERQIVASGIPVLRFTGSEILRDTQGCIVEIVRFVETRREGI